jgi:hypothetical protein
LGAAAQIALGNLYADGHGVSANLAVAYKWFDLAARYSPSPTERLVERWLPAPEITHGMYVGGDI